MNADRKPVAKTMFLQVGTRRYAVASFEQASQMFCTARDEYDRRTGKALHAQTLIVDEAGEAIAHVSYNGRVWPGREWVADVGPLYDNCPNQFTAKYREPFGGQVEGARAGIIEALGGMRAMS